MKADTNSSPVETTADIRNEDKNDEKNEKKDDMELILDDIGGSFGRFQILNYILFSYVLFISGLNGIAYIFTALDLEYR